MKEEMFKISTPVPTFFSKNHKLNSKQTQNKLKLVIYPPTHCFFFPSHLKLVELENGTKLIKCFSFIVLTLIHVLDFFSTS